MNHEHIITCIAGLLILTWLGYELWHGFFGKAYREARKFQTRHPKKCDCSLEQQYCNNQIQVSDQGVMSVPDYYKCPRFMRKVFKEAGNANVIIKITKSKKRSKT